MPFYAWGIAVDRRSLAAKLCKLYRDAMDSHRDIIELWPTVTDFSRDTGIKFPTAASMYRRGRIGAKNWPRVVAASRKLKKYKIKSRVSWALLARLAVPKS